jgi:hypothetical protein
MRAVFVVFSTLICLAFASNATEASQDPTPLPMDSSAPGLPQSDPSNLGAPDLLPESSALPPEKNAEIRTKAVPAAFSKSAAKTHQKRSEGSSEKTREHFERIRSVAMRSPHAQYLLGRARHSSTRDARRRYRQRYNAYVRERMNILDSDLKVSTVDLDRDKGSHARTAKSKVNKAHQRSHRYAHHTSRRPRLYFDEYGPPEMGPYGPPPYGPPAWWPGPPPGAY